MSANEVFNAGMVVCQVSIQLELLDLLIGESDCRSNSTCSPVLCPWLHQGNLEMQRVVRLALGPYWSIIGQTVSALTPRSMSQFSYRPCSSFGSVPTAAKSAHAIVARDLHVSDDAKVQIVEAAVGESPHRRFALRTGWRDLPESRLQSSAVIKQSYQALQLGRAYHEGPPW